MVSARPVARVEIWGYQNFWGSSIFIIWIYFRTLNNCLSLANAFLEAEIISASYGAGVTTNYKLFLEKVHALLNMVDAAVVRMRIFALQDGEISGSVEFHGSVNKLKLRSCR